MSRDWSEREVMAAVSDYFVMLDKELRDVPYIKANHRRALRSLLDERTEKSIERKHANISAVLVELGYPYLRGYKPLFNYQHALLNAVAERLVVDDALEQSVSASTLAPAAPADYSDHLSRMVDPPVRTTFTTPLLREAALGWRVRRGKDYLELESRNSELGLAGERFVVDFERARLMNAGADRLVDKVEHVSRTIGDGLGFDVRSFDYEGHELMIEVKTTGYGMLTPFFVSQNELRVSRDKPSSYQLYRLFDFRADPHLFSLQGSLDECCDLRPSQYLARVG